MKLCKKCDTQKELTEFYKHKQTRDGYETTCKQCLKATAAKWAKDNPHKNMEKSKRYNERHPERRKETLARYYKENKDKVSKSIKQWGQNNPEKIQEYGRTHANRRRARKLENGYEPYTEKQMIDTYGLLCNICKEPINFLAPRKVGELGWERGLHIDHVVPISKGGADILDNIRPTHGLCNLQKSDSYDTIVPTTE